MQSTLASAGVDLSPTPASTSAVVSSANGEVSLRASANNHFKASSLVEGTHVEFIVDTGATIVALTEFDAQRIGLDLSALVFEHPVNTANGTTYAATITLGEIEIGDIVIDNVQAAVLREGLEVSLLGMSFLQRLSSFEFDQDRLVMRQ